MHEKVLRDHQLVILTGAGISAESGIKTFRDDGGLWEGHRVEDVATPEAFENDSQKVWRFYNNRRAQLNQVKPNKAHAALAQLEKFLNDNFYLITQNVDDLHERAGSRKVHHMHGELLKVRCLSCNIVYKEVSVLGDHPLCKDCGGALRPYIVWFGEIPHFMDDIQFQLRNCDWFCAVGTSGLVYPAAGFLNMAKRYGAKTLVVNPDKLMNASDVDYFIPGKAGDVLPDLVESVCSGKSISTLIQRFE